MQDFRTERLLQLTVLASFLLALVNHLLPPKAFSATQLLFDYEFGLTRRGLFGAMLNLVAGPGISVGEVYAAAAFLNLAGAIALLVFLQKRFSQSMAGYFVQILAFNSFAFASFLGNTGYLDAALLALSLVALSTDGSRMHGLALRLGILVPAMLLHENMLPYFSVLIGFDLWLANAGRADRAWRAIAPILVAAGLLVALALSTGFSPDEAQSYAVHLQDKAGFRLDPNSTDVAGRSIRDNFALMAELRQTTKYWAWVLFDGVPLLAMSLWLIWLGLRVMGPGASGLSRLFLIGAILAPLSLNFIAFDVVRFGAASVLSGFVALGLLLRHINGAWERMDKTLTWPLFLLVLILNANIFTIEVNIGAGHTSQFPWVLLDQLKWMAR